MPRKLHSFVQHPTVDINESSVKFQATGCSGSRGEQLYSFEVELYDKIDAKVSSYEQLSICISIIIQASTYKMNDREISVNLKKNKADSNTVWPRLTKSSAKLPWLKVRINIQ